MADFAWTAAWPKSWRLAWRGLAVRARVGDGWAIAMPDVFSIRHTTVEAYLEPIVHEVKVRRSDLLADLQIAFALAGPALRRASKMGLAVWMALARATPAPGWQTIDDQSLLGDPCR